MQWSEPRRRFGPPSPIAAVNAPTSMENQWRRGGVATAGPGGVLRGTSDQLPAGHCGLRKRVRRAHEPTSPRAGYESFKVRERLGEQQRRPKGDRARHDAPGGACDQHVPAVLSLGRKQRGGRWDRLAKGRHRHSAIVVRSRRYRNARNGLLDGAHVRYSEDFGSDGLRPRIPR